MKNPNCPTTCRYHMPHVVVYVVPYVAPACWRPHRCCTPTANFPLAHVLKSRTLPPPNHKTIPRNVKSGPFIVSLDRPRSSDCLNRRRELYPSRTAAPCLQLGGRVARVGILSVVGRYPSSGYGASGWHRPTCVDFPTALPRETRARPPAKAPHAFAGGRSRGRVPTRRRKCTQVGRGARRARPVVWRHICMFRRVENFCPALP